MRIIFAVLLLTVNAPVGMAQQTQTQAQSQTQPATPSTDIFLAKLHVVDGSIQIREPVNITKRKGYDNQPFFIPDGQAIFYTSILEDGQSDIFEYEIATGASRRLTSTAESEFSPTWMPDGKYFSVVRVEADETQRLWKFPVTGGTPELILPDVKPVGYHTWIDANTLALFILGEPPTLQLVNLADKKPQKIAANIGRSLRIVPGKNQISFIEKKGPAEWVIQSYDLQTRQFETITRTLPEIEDFIWKSAGLMLSAKGSRIYQFRAGKDQSWNEVADLASHGIREITRLAVSPDGDYIALVSQE